MNTYRKRYSYDRPTQYGYVQVDSYDYRCIDTYRNGETILVQNTQRQYLTLFKNFSNMRNYLALPDEPMYYNIQYMAIDEMADNKWLIHAYDLNGGFVEDDMD